MSPAALKAFPDLETYRSFLLMSNNGFSFGFPNQVLCSNKRLQADFRPEAGKEYISFIPYGYKNHIEHFPGAALEEPVMFETEKVFFAGDVVAQSETGASIRSKPEVISKAQYLEKARQLKQHIQAGDIYEINYCIPFVYRDVKLDPFSLYAKLNSISLAPYSALCKLDDLYIICSSPERFLKKTGNTLITQPIKGTAKRSADMRQDILLREELLNSLKERTENIMIVDVARNDLSRIASRGSVRVEKLYEIQSFKQVHQMVSTVACDLKPNLGFKDIIHATFPMASMTGAPKIRAMQLIDEVEEMPRGPYSGCLGYIDKNGNFDLNVLIRSIFYNSKTQTAFFWVGSAITAMSEPEKEYEECLLKAKAMREVLES